MVETPEITEIPQSSAPQPDLGSFAAYEASRTAKPEEKPAAEPEKPVETSAQPETTEGSTEKAEKPKRDRTAEGRIAELTAQNKQLREEFERWKAEQAQPAKPAAQVDKTPEATNGGEPLLKDYVARLGADETYEDAQQKWLRDHKRWDREQERLEASKAKEEETSRETAKRVQGKFEEARTKYEDFDDVVSSNWVTPQIQAAVAEYLKEADSMDALYYLGKHPEEVERLSGLSRVRQLAEIGKIEAKLSTPEPKQPAAPPTSKAPAPIRNVSGGGEEAKVDLTKAKSFAEYERERLKQLKR